jgi:hypothetical protein
MFKQDYEAFLMQEKYEPRDHFWASDSKKSQFDLYHSFKGTHPTNPQTLGSQMKFVVQKGVELAIVQDLSKMNLLATKIQADSWGLNWGKDEQWRWEINLPDTKIKMSGKPDFILKDGVSGEIKTYYSPYQEKDLDAGVPKENYVMQLACNMLAMGLEKGLLIVYKIVTDSSQDPKMYCFDVTRNGTFFDCGNVGFDLREEFFRLEEIKKNFIDKNIEPPCEYKYKYPVEEVDWKALSNSKISNARNNRAVIGDFEVSYSPYKDLIVSREAEKLGLTFADYIGYNSNELEYIHAQTKNYTSKKVF